LIRVVRLKNSRHVARELAVQGLYEWLIAGNDARAILQRLQEVKSFERADRPLLDQLLTGVIAEAEDLQRRLTPLLDRTINTLSPVERAILMIGAFELLHRAETPYRVVINEAVELAKAYGGTDGHRYVNGVLDRLAAELRALEIKSANRVRNPR
jgi:N utilization substance protein B